MTCTPPTRAMAAPTQRRSRPVLPVLRTPRCRTAPGAQRPVRPRPSGRQEGAHTMPSAGASARSDALTGSVLPSPYMRLRPLISRSGVTAATPRALPADRG